MDADRKLSDADVVAIRVAAVERGEQRIALAERYGVTLSYVGRIVRGEQRVAAGGPTAYRPDGRPPRDHYAPSYSGVDLDSLPDSIALARDAGLPVILERPTPLPPHAQRLMDTLGVEVRIVTAALTEHGSRAVLAPRAVALRDAGLSMAAIAAELGVSRSYASSLYNDPDGSKERARKDSYRGACEACGEPTDGSNGPSNAPSVCARCKPPNVVWTREAIVAAFVRFHEETGRQPTTVDRMATAGSLSVRNGLSAERLEEIDHARERGLTLPTPQTVNQRFGSWRAALEAAGMRPNAIGGPALVSRRGQIFTPADLELPDLDDCEPFVPSKAETLDHLSRIRDGLAEERARLPEPPSAFQALVEAEIAAADTRARGIDHRPAEEGPSQNRMSVDGARQSVRDGLPEPTDDESRALAEPGPERLGQDDPGSAGARDETDAARGEEASDETLEAPAPPRAEVSDRLIVRILRLSGATIRDASSHAHQRDRLVDVAASLEAIADYLDESAQ